MYINVHARAEMHMLYKEKFSRGMERESEKSKTRIIRRRTSICDFEIPKKGKSILFLKVA